MSRNLTVAVAFWGLTRSLNLTIGKIEENVFQVFNNNNVTYTVYMHTYNHFQIYNNPRGNELNIALNNSEYALLKPNFLEIEDHGERSELLNVSSYMTHGCPWNSPNGITLRNFVIAMHSKMRVTMLINKSNMKFDFILFLRPDLYFFKPWQMSYFDKVNDTTVAVSRHDVYHGMNDRACICTQQNMQYFGMIFPFLLNYSLHHQMGSELVHGDFMRLNHMNIHYIDLQFYRIRANGVKITNDG